MASGSTSDKIEQNGSIKSEGIAKKNYTYEIVIIGALFFAMGFITWINGSLIAFLKIACDLTNFQSSLVPLAFFIAYFVMGLPAAGVLKLLGYKKGMVMSLFVMAIGAVLFIPAAQTRTYSIFITALFVIGTGLALLQAASNPYVTVLGPIESGARRISIMGICNKVAGGIGTVVLGMLLFGDIEPLEKRISTLKGAERTLALDVLSSKIVPPYVVVPIVLVLLGLLVAFSKLPEINAPAEDVATETKDQAKRNVFGFPNFVLGVIAMFLYVGAEVVAGDSIITFGKTQGIDLKQARYFTLFPLGAMVLGYIIGVIVMPRYIKQDKALAVSSVLGIAFSTAVVVSSGWASIVFLALLGLANSIMYPCIWPLAIDRLGKFTKIASAFLVMALSGGGVILMLLLRLFDEFPMHTQYTYLILLPCYLFILFYALNGSKKRAWA